VEARAAPSDQKGGQAPGVARLLMSDLLDVSFPPHTAVGWAYCMRCQMISQLGLPPEDGDVPDPPARDEMWHPLAYRPSTRRTIQDQGLSLVGPERQAPSVSAPVSARADPR
jgi:hypothetical protein